MAGITFEQVNKIYDDGMHAVTDLNLDVKDGELVVFVVACFLLVFFCEGEAS